MKKVLCMLAVAAMLVACKEKNKPEEPAEKPFDYVAVGTIHVPIPEFSKEGVTVEVWLKEQKADIYLYEVTFSDRMPLTINMMIPDVDYVRTEVEITLSGDQIAPMMGENPVDRYMVANLQGKITKDSMFISNSFGNYACEYKGKLEE